MSVHDRRQRERDDRHRLIVDTARELAETEGWEAVTIRKLAERIEYSQPVLYSHFAGKRAIVTAVALDGIAELTATLRQARTAAAADSDALAAAAHAYCEFASRRPAVYDAMFAMSTDLHFGPEAPQPLRDAFAELVAVLTPFAGDDDVESFAETGWSALHGLVTLERGQRLRPGLRDDRLAILCRLLQRSPIPDTAARE